jgi:hypothetical protein
VDVPLKAAILSEHVLLVSATFNRDQSRSLVTCQFSKPWYSKKKFGCPKIRNLSIKDGQCVFLLRITNETSRKSNYLSNGVHFVNIWIEEHCFKWEKHHIVPVL